MALCLAQKTLLSLIEVQNEKKREDKFLVAGVHYTKNSCTYLHTGMGAEKSTKVDGGIYFPASDPSNTVTTTKS